MISALDRLRGWHGALITLLAAVLALAAGLLLVRVTPLGGGLLVALAVLSVATLVEPLIGLGAALFLSLLWAYLRAEVPQVPAQVGQFFVALTLASWLARGLARREFHIYRPPIAGPLVIFFGTAALSLWDAVELPVYGIPELLKWAQILLLFLFVSHALTRRHLPWLLGVLLATGLFQAAVGVWQFALRGEGPVHFAVVDGRFYRAYGTFEQPNPYAGYIGMTLALALGVAIGALAQRAEKHETNELSPPAPRSRQELLPLPRWLPALFLVIVALGLALGMSWSRGAWLGFGAAVLVMILALPRRARRGLLIVVLLVAVGVGLYLTDLPPDPLRSRLTGFSEFVRFEDVRGTGINDANYAVIERLAHWQAALEMFRHNLWTGVGFGCFEPAYSDFDLINWPIPLGHAHNYYLNIAAETGLIGLSAYLGLWAAVFWRTWQAIRRATGVYRGLAIGLLGAWTQLSTHHLLDNLFVNNVHLHIGVLLGLLAFIVQQTSCSATKPANAY